MFVMSKFECSRQTFYRSKAAQVRSQGRLARAKYRNRNLTLAIKMIAAVKFSLF